MTFLTFCTRPRGLYLPCCWPLFPQMPWPWLLYGSVAFVPCTNSCLNSHLPLPLMHHAASISFYPSCLALSSLVSSCLILPISCPCYPYLSPLHTPSLPLPRLPSLSLSVSPSFSSLHPSLPCAVEVSYDAEPESSPMFNYINKTPCEVEWPRTPQPSLHPPHPSPSTRPSLPVVLQA